MPLYHYQCKGCEHIQEIMLPMGRRDEPVDIKCPECGQMKVKKIIAKGTGNLVSGVNTSTKMSDGWKDVMRGVKNANPPNNIPDY